MKITRITKGNRLEINGDNSLLCLGDAYTTLLRLPSNSMQCAVTSPPYWGLRDYEIQGQIGLEPSLDHFIAELVRVFREVWRTLKDDGTLWLNIGDAYTSGNRGYRAPDKKHRHRAMSVRPATPDGLKPKDLIGIPWRLAFALQDDGWFLRSDIVWHKPNAMPESVKDRPARCHEYLFMLTKSEKYKYDHEAVREDAANGQTRNRRTVWQLNTQASKWNHAAAFPNSLVEPCLLASTDPGDYVLDPFFGSGTVGEVALSLDRRFVGIELNPDYAQVASERLAECTQLPLHLCAN